MNVNFNWTKQKCSVRKYLTVIDTPWKLSFGITSYWNNFLLLLCQLSFSSDAIKYQIVIWAS